MSDQQNEPIDQASLDMAADWLSVWEPNTTPAEYWPRLRAVARAILEAEATQARRVAELERSEAGGLYRCTHADTRPATRVVGRVCWNCGAVLRRVCREGIA